MQILEVIFIIGCHTFQALDAALFILGHVPVRPQLAVACLGRSVDPLQAILQLWQTLRSPPVNFVNESLQVCPRRLRPAPSLAVLPRLACDLCCKLHILRRPQLSACLHGSQRMQ